jgi:hypothetical protein
MSVYLDALIPTRARTGFGAVSVVLIDPNPITQPPRLYQLFRLTGGGVVWSETKAEELAAAGFDVTAVKLNAEERAYLASASVKKDFIWPEDAWFVHCVGKIEASQEKGIIRCAPIEGLEAFTWAEAEATKMVTPADKAAARSIVPAGAIAGYRVFGSRGEPTADQNSNTHRFLGLYRETAATLAKCKRLQQLMGDTPLPKSVGLRMDTAALFLARYAQPVRVLTKAGFGTPEGSPNIPRRARKAMRYLSKHRRPSFGVTIVQGGLVALVALGVGAAVLITQNIKEVARAAADVAQAQASICTMAFKMAQEAKTPSDKIRAREAMQICKRSVESGLPSSPVDQVTDLLKVALPAVGVLAGLWFLAPVFSQVGALGGEALKRRRS